MLTHPPIWPSFVCLVGAFIPEKALVVAFSMIVKSSYSFEALNEQVVST